MRSIGVDIPEKEIIGLPKTLEEIKAIPLFEFQNWVCSKLFARASKTKVGDLGVDGWLLNGRPLQVKQSEHVGRPVIDSFKATMTRAGRNKGIIVALSFGKGAYEEVARAKQEEGLEIELKTLEDLMTEE